MPETDEFKSLRSLALASLGRNVLHFQRLEVLLKQLTLFCDFQSPMDQFAANHKKRSETINMKTMGTVVGKLHERLYGEPTDPETIKPIAESSLSIQFRVKADPDSVNLQRLKDLVVERIRMIHQDIGEFNPNSEESCRHWITRLDEQNERILTKLKEVKHMVDTCREGLAAMSTDEWRQWIEQKPEHP